MLQNLEIFSDEAVKQISTILYQDEYKWYFPSPYRSLDNVFTHDIRFVSVDKDGNVVGYIGFDFDRASDSVDCIGIISFTKYNMTFMRDLYIAFHKLFMEWGANRVAWSCIVGNPVLSTYEKLCKKYNGRVCGYNRRNIKLIDGELHDTEYFEVMKSEYMQYYTSHQKKRKETK